MTLTDWTALAALFALLCFAGPTFYLIYSLGKDSKKQAGDK